MTDYAPGQKAALKALIEQLKEEYPEAEVYGNTKSRCNMWMLLIV